MEDIQDKINRINNNFNLSLMSIDKDDLENSLEEIKDDTQMILDEVDWQKNELEELIKSFLKLESLVRRSYRKNSLNTITHIQKR